MIYLHLMKWNENLLQMSPATAVRYTQSTFLLLDGKVLIICIDDLEQNFSREFSPFSLNNLVIENSNQRAWDSCRETLTAH